MMAIERHLSLVEEILGGFKEVIGVDFNAYRNHVYRVANLCYAAGDFDGEAKEKIQIAACFHDIGIWTAKTLDYLPPSRNEAEKYLTHIGKASWASEVGEMIEMHHRTRSCADSPYPLVQAFRRADVADFSLGLVRMGLPRRLITELKEAFPNRGFHLRLVKLGSAWFIKHPLNPLPMFRP
jgi:hypothetical protein